MVGMARAWCVWLTHFFPVCGHETVRCCVYALSMREVGRGGIASRGVIISPYLSGVFSKAV